MESGLYVVATPIGNLGDMSPRAVEVLQGADIIAAEDTRHSLRLLQHFGITTKISMPLAMQSAHAISPAIMVLDDAGVMGVKLVNDNNIVEFAPVHVVEESVDGVWVSGLPDSATIIVVGQEVVFSGNKVKVDLAPLENL